MTLTLAQVRQLSDEQLLVAFEANVQTLQRLHRELEDAKNTEKLLVEAIVLRYREIVQTMTDKNVAFERLKTSLREILEVARLCFERFADFEGLGRSQQLKKIVLEEYEGYNQCQCLRNRLFSGPSSSLYFTILIRLAVSSPSNHSIRFLELSKRMFLISKVLH